MHSQYGLVCVTYSDEVRYRTISQKRLLQHALDEQRTMLCMLYEENIRRLRRAINFCKNEGIALTAFLPRFFSCSDEEVGRDTLSRFACDLARLGEEAVRRGVRLVMHPDQLVVLNSESHSAMLNSIKILNMHAATMDLLQQPRLSWALIEIHGGRSNRAAELIKCIRRLPEAVRSRLGLENDAYAYGAKEIHSICMETGIPMVFDAHRHVVKEKLASYEDPSIGEMLLKARETWSEPTSSTGAYFKRAHGLQ